MSTATLTAPTVHQVAWPQPVVRTVNRPTVQPTEAQWLEWLDHKYELNLEIITVRTANNEPITDYHHLVKTEMAAFISDMADLDSLFVGR